MDLKKKGDMLKKMKNFASLAGKLNVLSSAAQQKKQEELEAQNLMNIEIEKGIAKEKFFNALQRKNKTDTDAKLILQNIQDYESINKLFGKDTEPSAKLMIETFQKGQAIVKQNEPSNNKFYVIAQGSVVIVKATDTNVFQIKEEDKNVQATQGNQPGTEPEKDNRRISMLGKKKEKEPEDPLQTEIKKYGKEINQLKLGQGFGEAAIIESDPRKAKRGATILAREDNTNLIIIMKREFQKFKDTFSSQGKEKALILTSLIPQLKLINSTQTRDDLIFYFQEEGGLRGQALTIEGKPGDKIFILKEGQLQIEKNYVNEKNIYYHDIQKLKISTISDPSFVGEEILQDTNEDNQKVYNYTITISSIQARFYSIKKQILMFKFPNLKQDILNEYEMKEQHRKKTVEYILSKNQQPSNMISVGDTLHEYNKLKNIDLFSQMKTSMVEIHNKNVFKDIVKQEKFQTPEDIQKIRMELLKEFEEKKQTEYKSSSQTQLPLPEELPNNINQLQLNQRPTTGLSRKSLARASQQQLQIPSLSQLSNFEETKAQNPLRLNTGGASAPALKTQLIKNIFQQENTNNNEQPRNSQLKNLPAPVPLDPVYSKKYQEQHDLEQNFMENLQEKLKQMSKAQQIQKEAPQLDLGYLEQFKKKQQLKLQVQQKASNKNSQLYNNRLTVMQKKIDQIKNKYLKESPEQEIIVQDGLSIQNSNSNNMFNTILSKSQSENTPKSHTITNDSQDTPLSQKGVKGMRKSYQGNAILKFSNFKTDGNSMTPNKNSQVKGNIVKQGSFSLSQQGSGSPLLKSHYIMPSVQSVPSLFALNSQRDHQNNSNSISMTTPQNLRSNSNLTLLKQNINFSSLVQNSKIKSQGSLIIQHMNNIDERQDSNESQSSHRLSTNYIVPKSSPLKIKTSKLNFDNPNNSIEETAGSNHFLSTQHHQNSSHQDSNRIKSASEFVQDKPSKGVQVQPILSNFSKKELIFSSQNFSPLDKPLKFGDNFLDKQRCSTAIQLKRKSLQRQKLKTGLSFQRKPNQLYNQI